jgi:hypothetical protein
MNNLIGYNGVTHKIAVALAGIIKQGRKEGRR